MSNINIDKNTISDFKNREISNVKIFFYTSRLKVQANRPYMNKIN